MPFVYILQCGDGSFYTGIAKQLNVRIQQHQEGHGSRYTRAHLPVRLVWSRKLRTWRQAMREERRIKRLRRRGKEALFAAGPAPARQKSGG